MLPTTLCLAESHAQAAQIVEKLRAAEVALSNVSVMSLPSNADERPAPFEGLSYPNTETVKTAAGAMAGGISGILAGIGTMAVVGLTPLLMIAPLVVAGGAAVGVLAGSVVTGLSGFGVADARADHYQKALLAGGFLVAVQTEDERELATAQKVFSEQGGKDVETYRYTRRLT
jgi:tetrahydromethanopterin S-methyltransferase subunit B